MKLSQKIIRGFLGEIWLSPPWRGIELHISLLEVLVDFDDGCSVSTTAAIVRSREYRHQMSVMVWLVPLIDHLMRPSDFLEAVGMIELHRIILN